MNRLAANESGFLQVIAILVFLALIIGVVIAAVLGLDSTYEKMTSRSMLREGTKISEIKDRVQEKKDDLKLLRDQIKQRREEVRAQDQADAAKP